MTKRNPDADSQSPQLDASDVPPDLQHLIPLAERFGISDDGYRGDMLRALSGPERADLAECLSHYDDALDTWLAGPESHGPTFSDAYVAFSALRMAADEVGL